MSDLFFSVIVPVYNVGNYLRECVDSILKQTCRDFEVLLIVDEKCTDNSGEISAEYAFRDERVIKIMRGHNGLGDARNCGIENARGKYLIFIDSDDYLLESDYFEHIKGVAEKSGADYIVSRYRKFDECNSNLCVVGENWGSQILEGDSIDAMVLVLNSGYFNISAWAKAVKREFIVNIGLFFGEGYSEDVDWTGKILNSTKKMAFLNDAAYVYRVREGSLSHHAKLEQYLDLANRIITWRNLISGNSAYDKAQLGYLAYEYYIYVGNIYNLPKKQRGLLWAKEQEMRDLRKYAFSKKTKMCSLLHRVCGVEITAFILHLYISKKRV